MIDQARIAKAASDADRAVEMSSLPQWALAHDINLGGLCHVAEQRALRSAMLFDGTNPNDRTTREVRLSASAARLMVTLTGVWLDGFAAAFTLTK